MPDPILPPVRLSGDIRVQWATRAARLLSDRRLSRQFVPPTSLGALAMALAEGHGGDTVELDPRSGLPTLRPMLAAHTATGAGPGRFDVDARLRKRTSDGDLLRIVVDRYEPAGALWRRLTLEVESRGSREVSIEEDRATLSGTLRDTLFRYAAADPELLFLRLRSVPRIAPIEVRVGETGPLVHPSSTPPPPLDAIAAACPTAMWLCARSARVQQGDDFEKRRDPIGASLAEQVGAEAWAELRAAFGAGYGVTTDLQIVAEREAVAACRRGLPKTPIHIAR